MNIINKNFDILIAFPTLLVELLNKYLDTLILFPLKLLVGNTFCILLYTSITALSNYGNTFISFYILITSSFKLLVGGYLTTTTRNLFYILNYYNKKSTNESLLYT